MARSSSLKRAEEVVNKLLADYNLRDPEKLCKELGLTIYDCPDFQDLKGMYACISGRPCIFVKADLSTSMRKVILAHELGHHLLHNDILGDLAIVQDHSFFDMSSLPELEANLFAAELLLDDANFLDLAKRGLSLEQLAGAFEMPVELMQVKADILYHKGVKLRLPEPVAADFLKDA